MAQPRTKAQLLTATEKERDALQVLLSRLSPEDMVRPGAYGWSAKDHVAHLSEWERMLFGWYEAGWRGEEPGVPAEGYTWASMDALNQRLFERHRDDPPAHVLADWQQTSRQLQLLAEQVSEAFPPESVRLDRARDAGLLPLRVRRQPLPLVDRADQARLEGETLAAKRRRLASLRGYSAGVQTTPLAGNSRSLHARMRRGVTVKTAAPGAPQSGWSKSYLRLYSAR